MVMHACAPFHAERPAGDEDMQVATKVVIPTAGCVALPMREVRQVSVVGAPYQGKHRLALVDSRGRLSFTGAQ